MEVLMDTDGKNAAKAINDGGEGGKRKKLWWYTQGEENLHGCADTRDEAIAKGSSYFCGEPFLICEGAHFNNVVPVFDIDRIAENFDDANADYSGEDEGPSAAWSDEACRELEDALTAVMDAWLDKHGYRKAWAIDCGPYERITTPDHG